MRLAVGVGLGFLLGLLTAAPAGAVRLEVHPELRTSVVYDDNIYLERDGGESDVAVWIQPRIRTELNRGRLRAGADLGLDSRFYTSNSRLNETFWNTRAFLEYRPRENWLLRLSDDYVPRPLARGRPEDETANLRQSNTLAAELRWRRELPRESALELGVIGTRFDTEGFRASVDTDGDGIFEDFRRFQSDYNEVSAFLEGQVQLAREAQVFARAEARRRGYDDLDSGDFDELFGMVGLRTQLTPRIGFEGAVGYGTIDFSELPTESRFLGRVEFDWELPRAFTVKVSALRRLSGDTTGTDFGETSARLSVQKRLGSRTRIELGAWWTQFENDAGGSRSNSAVAGELRLTRQLTSRIAAALSFRHWRNRGRNDDDDFKQNRVILELVYRY